MIGMKEVKREGGERFKNVRWESDGVREMSSRGFLHPSMKKRMARKARVVLKEVL